MKTITIALGIFCVILGHLSAQVPQLLNYQGRVAVDGVNFDGTGQFKFALVDAAGTTTYWSNDGTVGSEPAAAVTLTVTKGLYSVLLGDTTLMTSLPPSVFTNPDVRLRVWFDDGANGFQLLNPDHRIASVGYALNAASAETVADGAVTSSKLAAGAVTGAALAAGSVTTGALADNTVTSAKILDGAIGNAEVNASAGIDFSKMASLTADRALLSDGSGAVSVSAVTNEELEHLAGTTSPIQSQLNSKQDALGPGSTTDYLRGDLLWGSFGSEVRGTFLAGFSAGPDASVVGSDTILDAFGKLQAQIDSVSGSSVNSVDVTVPLASSGGADPVISIEQSGASTDGFLSSLDWNTFNDKLDYSENLNTMGNLPTGIDHFIAGDGANWISRTPVQARTSLGLGTAAVSDRSTSTSLGTSNTLLPTQNAVKVYVDNAFSSAGTVTSVGAGVGLLGGPITTAGTLSVDTGTTANKIVQLDASARLPGVNGSMLFSLNANNISSGTISNLHTTGTHFNLANTLVLRDASGDFSARIISATIFSGSGSGLTSLNATQISTGIISNFRTTGTSSNNFNTLVLRNASGGFSAGSITVSSIGATGVLGEVTGTSGTNYGVYGKTNSAAGYGGFFLGRGYFSQRLGVGTTSPQTPLHVLTSTDNDSFLNVAILGRTTSTVDFHTVGVQGESTGSLGRGVYGSATHTSGNTHGVYGSVSSTAGTGVRGEVTATTGTNYGVYGETNSAAGYGGYFLGRGYFSQRLGVGTTAPETPLHVLTGTVNASFYNAAILGRTTSTVDFHTVGVQGESTGEIGRGVYGSATHTSGENYGVYGLTTSAAGYGGYFVGRGYFSSRLGVGTVPHATYRLALPNTASDAGRGVANRWDTYSSGRWKENVRVIEEPLDKVLALRGVRYDWTEQEETSSDIGFIAEEVGQVLPEIVSYEAGGEHATAMDYSRLTPLLVEAIKAQQDQIVAQQNQIAALIARLEKLENAAAD